MILVYGHHGDQPVEQLLKALRSSGARHQFLDPAALAQAALHMQVGPWGMSGDLVIAHHQIALEDIQAVYLRPVPAAYGAVPNPSPTTDLQQHLLDWLDVAPALVVNRPAAIQANVSKPWQVQQIGHAGLPVPPMLVSSDESEVRHFIRTHERIVFTSTSGARFTATEREGAWLSHMHRLPEGPTQFQAYVPGVDVRVMVVGSEVFAAQARGALAEWSSVQLPDAVAAQCVALTEALGLAMAGIDLRRCMDGSYVCFDVNPLPAFSGFEGSTGLPVAATLAEMLAAVLRKN